MIIAEYNSENNTPSLLYQWMRKNPKVYAQAVFRPTRYFESWIVNITDDGQFFRPEETAHARNEVLDIAMSNAYEDFPYVIWIDMECMASPAFDGITGIFQMNNEWDAVSAYGIDFSGNYKDWNAHRDIEYPIGPELLGDCWNNLVKTCELSGRLDWYPVYSAFGGCGVYKKSSIIGYRYSALVTNDLEKLTKQLNHQGKITQQPQILKYLTDLEKLSNIIYIQNPIINLPKITDPTIGIVTHIENDPIIWKMNSSVYQYPSFCEHVPFHALMILNGHGKLFINPRLVMAYSDPLLH